MPTLIPSAKRAKQPNDRNLQLGILFENYAHLLRICRLCAFSYIYHEGMAYIVNPCSELLHANDAVCIHPDEPSTCRCKSHQTMVEFWRWFLAEPSVEELMGKQDFVPLPKTVVATVLSWLKSEVRCDGQLSAVQEHPLVIVRGSVPPELRCGLPKILVSAV